MIFQLQEINTASCCAMHLYNHTARKDEIIEKVCNCNAPYFNEIMSVTSNTKLFLRYVAYSKNTYVKVSYFQVFNLIVFIVLFTVSQLHSSQTTVEEH